MAEYIEREALIVELDKPTLATGAYGAGVTIATDRAVTVVRCAPAADVVEVVRCKDCIYSAEAKENEKGFLICPASRMEITDMDFCSYGERRNTDG